MLLKAKDGHGRLSAAPRLTHAVKIDLPKAASEVNITRP
jgi:hypothetical protein